jgi:hypothetical protein
MERAAASAPPWPTSMRLAIHEHGRHKRWHRRGDEYWPDILPLFDLFSDFALFLALFFGRVLSRSYCTTIGFK